MSIKTVVELDLVGYSKIGIELEQSMGVEVVARFNAQIQGFVDAGLIAVGAAREKIVLATTGDGAILAFDNAPDAHRFAAAVHMATQKHNAERTVPSSLRWFRIGAATGDLNQGTNSEGKITIAGMVIADAVRLEAAALPGQFVVDPRTYNLLHSEFQALYGEEEVVVAKHDIRYNVRRWTTVPHTPAEDARPTPKSTLQLFDRLNPRDQLKTLLLLVDMSPQFRPSDALPLYRRQDEILDWAVTQGDAGLSKLDAALKYLIERQQPSRP